MDQENNDIDIDENNLTKNSNIFNFFEEEQKKTNSISQNNENISQTTNMGQ